jgi:aerobic carbon-monoxide dehydrogenase large subunit
MTVRDRFLRIEDMPLLRGAAIFTSDVGAADDLHMAIVRSTYPAGLLRDVDPSAAFAMPGVVAVLTGRDWAEEGMGLIQSRLRHPGPDGGTMRCPPNPPIAVDCVRTVGEPVALVLARSRHEAEDAAEQVVCDIEEQEPVTDLERALAPDAPRVWPEFPDNLCFRVEKGDPVAVAEAFGAAAHVVRQRLRVSRVTAAAMEPRAARAGYDAETGRFTLELGTQAPHRVTLDLAEVLGVDAKAIHTINRACGGSFGMKNFGYAEYALTLWAARRTGRTVRWHATRVESFMSDAHGRDQMADAALALDADGRILALQVAIHANLGARLGPATVHPPVANLDGLCGVYRTPAIHVTVNGVFTNTQQTAPYRGAGRPEATYVIERMIDLAAGQLGLDRAELRRRNLITPDQMPYQTPLVFNYDSGDFPAILDEALDVADWQGFEARRAESAARGRLRGIGIANPIEIAGGPAPKPNPEYARISLTPKGATTLFVGSGEAGQGHTTSYRLLVAEQLGLDPEAVTVVTGDTDLVARGTGTFGSRTLSAAGTALHAGMTEIVERLKPVAAGILEAPASDVEFRDTNFGVVGTNRWVGFGEVLSHLEAGIDVERYEAAAGPTFPNGCHVCEVEIDPDTGRVELLRYVVVDDVGRVLNPAIVKGQIVGGVAQGVGQALGEQIAYDPDSGQLLSASFMDYAMPRACDLPAVEVISHPVPTTRNVLGVKGVGEAGTVGALAAVMSAVSDALRPYGVAHLEMPATPARVWQAIRDAGGVQRRG